MVVQVDNISYSIAKKTILSNISLKVEEGKFITVLGCNGAGKTSLIKCISSPMIGRTGSVLISGKKIEDYSVRELATRRSVLTQHNDISFDFKVKDIVSFGRYVHHDIESKDVDQVIEELKITNLSDRIFSTLSGGEQQKVQLARVLVQLLPKIKGKLLILDEPMTFLDLRYQREVLDILKSMCVKGLTVISVLHDINVAFSVSDDVLLLREGEMVGYGSVNSTMTEEKLSCVYDAPISKLKTQSGEIFFK